MLGKSGYIYKADLLFVNLSTDNVKLRKNVLPRTGALVPFLIVLAQKTKAKRGVKKQNMTFLKEETKND